MVIVIDYYYMFFNVYFDCVILTELLFFLSCPVKDWDDIIPEAERKKIEELELQQQLKELNLPPRSRKQVNDVRNVCHFEFKTKLPN